MPYHAAVGMAGEPFPHSPPASLCLSLLLPPASAQNYLCCPKTAQQPAWPCASDPTDVHSLSRHPGARWWLELGGEFEEGATARGGGELARLTVGFNSYLARCCLGHRSQPHPLYVLRALGSLHVLGHPSLSLARQAIIPIVNGSALTPCREPVHECLRMIL